MSGEHAAVVAETAGRLAGLVRPDQPLGELTTYRVGGPAALWVDLEEETIDAVSEAVAATGIEVLVLGKGSNLLVADSGFDGLVVKLSESFDWVRPGRDEAEVGGATALPVLARRSAAAALTGLEWAVGVPGSVGGGVRMNAGGHGSDMHQCLAWARLADLRGGGIARVGPAELAYGYRRSAVQAHQVVLAAGFTLAPGSRAASEATISEIVRWRRENQPGGQNAGSVFTNPEGDSAGRLIEQAGLKGRRQGSALVSPKHANFIQADPGGSADDVRRLMDLVRSRVQEETGVVLETEVRLIGFAGEGQ